VTERATADTIRLEATVRGRVQGVGFRYFVMRRATGLALTGWVANEADGSVRTVAEGPRADLESFLATLQEGPPAAIVDRVVVAWGPAVGDLGPFSIRSGAHRGD
jgi:acylphosphatase